MFTVSRVSQFIRVVVSTVLMAVSLPCLATLAQQAEFADKTLSPYFMVLSADSAVDQMPLQATSATVNIAGVIADVKVTQVYKNDGQRPLEAMYVFPGSTRAAVYGMKMTIGERVLVAQVAERGAARQRYEQAKQEGRSASLLEQQRPNVFQMNVANIMPGDRIEVELQYTELLVPTDGIYEFVYPTVVGPRYSNMPEATTPASEKWVANPYLREGEAPPYTFDLAVTLSTGLPIQQATSPSHKVNIQYDSRAFATVKLDASEQQGGNRDFILKYQLAGGQIESGLLLFDGQPTPAPSQEGNEKFFLLMVQPPKQVQATNIPPREYIFIVDVSGSMHGYPLEISKTLLKNLIGNLQPHEQFNVLLFAGMSAILSESGSLPATAENVKTALAFIERQQGSGGTEILPALQRALALPKTEGISRTIVIATDGYVNVEPQVFDLIRNNLGAANMFAFGIGTSVNRLLIEGMAHVGLGEPFVLTKPDEAAQHAEKFRQYIQSPVLTQITTSFNGFDVYDVEPLSIPDVLSERPVIVFGKWKGAREGTITLAGFTGGQQHYEQSFHVAEVAPRTENAALRYLWARQRIMILGDYNQLWQNNERVQMITNLGLQYNLLTQYTSFVAVDTVVRNTEKQAPTPVKQPLPLPQGVSNLAVGTQQQAPVQVTQPLPLPQDSSSLAVGFEPALSSGVVLAGNGLNVPTSGGNLSATPVASSELTIKDVVVENQAISAEWVTSQVEDYLSTLATCVSAQTSRGEIEVKLTITSDGRVSAVEVLWNDMETKLETCFLEQMQEWLFTGLGNHDTIEVRVTFEML